LAARGARAAGGAAGGRISQSRIGRIGHRPLASPPQGLNEAGFTEGRNVAIEYRWANLQVDRLPGLAADLVRRQAAVIAATGSLVTVLAAKGAAPTTPIVFNVGIDPVKAGLVAALNKPGGHITGITSVNTQLGSKLVGLMHELLPNATRFALLVYRDDPANAMVMITSAQEAAAALGLQIEILYASTGADIETALAGVVQKQAGALIIAPGNLFIQRRVQIATLAARDGVPAIYVNRAFPAAGGLMSYGSDYTDTFRQAGVYCGRILKGEKPADLPVLQQTKFHLVINLSTAKALRLQVPPTLLALADEVIE
jgi:putative tryptophan/tyrosine transport system substrate-binding protein